jgi:hypothetical protein
MDKKQALDALDQIGKAYHHHPNLTSSDECRLGLEVLAGMGHEIADILPIVRVADERLSLRALLIVAGPCLARVELQLGAALSVLPRAAHDYSIARRDEEAFGHLAVNASLVGSGRLELTYSVWLPDERRADDVRDHQTRSQWLDRMLAALPLANG